MINKLILGTAALGGQKYNGKKIPLSESESIIKRALKCGINHFDTAPSYGSAMDLLFSIIPNHDGMVIVKTNGEHNTYFYNPGMVFWHNWDKGGDEYGYGLGNVDGVSIYQDQLKNAIKAGYRHIEMEWNLLRQVEIPEGITMYARSVFGRGLINKFPQARDVAQYLGLNVYHMFLQAALQHPRINYVIIGPQSVKELEECVEWSRKPLPFFGCLDIKDRSLTDPRNY